MEQQTRQLLIQYKAELSTELDAILAYWAKNTFDSINGCFAGRIDENNIIQPGAPKGSVLNSRILWAFSAAYSLANREEYLHLARVACNYIIKNFIDGKYGGVYWTLHANGKPLDTKKQVYALAFTIYGCSAYHQASNDELAKNTAIELYRVIEQFSFDEECTGYLDAFTRDWKEMDDIRLSAKDANEKKTMNTHLHILEAYTALYKIWPDDSLKGKIILLIKNFIEYIIDSRSHHLMLFFDEWWNVKSGTISYGHDIEASWLLLEAAEATGDGHLIAACKNIAVKIAVAAAEGVDKDGGLFYEYEPGRDHFIKEKHSWVQAEAMVGFFNAWQISGDVNFLNQSLQSWNYTKEFIRDHQYGEWYWGRAADGTVMKGQDKAGIWKCPYHNTRACIEIISRVSAVLSKNSCL
ncbi:MAG: AGE family epimerase/isomerase [Chitinophagaceae bacterium]|nr:AGE family epimerase/isomerase [Chitinophagaceae bacterium]